MNNLDSLGFRALNEQEDWSFFDVDLALCEEDRSSVYALSRSTATKLWCGEISDQAGERHLAEISGNHWTRQCKFGPNWTGEWNSGAGNEIRDFLAHHFSPLCDEYLYFILMKDTAYTAPVRVVTAYWRVFLGLDDEAPLMLHPCSGKFALFGPNGQVYVGQRLSGAGTF